MSTYIGKIVSRDNSGPSDEEKTRAVGFIYTSRNGVELTMDPKSTLDPLQARLTAAKLVAAADEVERMRVRAITQG